MEAEQNSNIKGTIAFDSHGNVIESTGVGSTRIEDICELSRVALDAEGFAQVQGDSLLVHLYKRDDVTLAVYTGTH
ncbi:YCR075W-A [Saccharomyces arboricola H-6]|uniref:YCR075W-A n=1 Tax=Saccharomyces arboricola (strain H-6 / AS 2.3317 / CBS 10644) TaxID=1160507 RepID=J8QA58_SACAR|nr:YCR075W-A [Saccharomyces arboricola H-6]